MRTFEVGDYVRVVSDKPYPLLDKVGKICSVWGEEGFLVTIERSIYPLLLKELQTATLTEAILSRMTE